MRHCTRSLSVPIVLAAALAACSGDAEVDIGASPDTTTTETAAADMTATETETLAAPIPTHTATESGASPSPSPTDPDKAALAFTTCEADRYTIGYPEDWDVNEPNQYVDACSLFHPGDVETPEDPHRGFHWAAVVDVMAGEYEQVIARDDGNEELSSQQITVDGRDAVVREYRSTGTTNLPEGERWYAYTVDLDGEILVASTSTVGETDYERDKKVLDRMVNEELTIND